MRRTFALLATGAVLATGSAAALATTLHDQGGRDDVVAGSQWKKAPQWQRGAANIQDLQVITSRNDRLVIRVHPRNVTDNDTTQEVYFGFWTDGSTRNFYGFYASRDSWGNKSTNLIRKAQLVCDDDLKARFDDEEDLIVFSVPLSCIKGERKITGSARLTAYDADKGYSIGSDESDEIVVRLD